MTDGTPIVPADLLERAESFVVPLDAKILERLARYLEVLKRGNERMNLVRFQDDREAWERHLLDSLSLLPWVDALDEGEPVIDLGSGAGMPGIPIALARPDRKVILVEATQKKAKFLEEARTELGLTKVAVVNKRAEDMGRDPNHRDRYPLVVARAVARLPVLLELALPLVRIDGQFLAMKGEKAEEELEDSDRALSELCGEASIEPLDAFFPGRNACVVQVDKIRRTPRDYPRPAGIPERKPL